MSDGKIKGWIDLPEVSREPISWIGEVLEQNYDEFEVYVKDATGIANTMNFEIIDGGIRSPEAGFDPLKVKLTCLDDNGVDSFHTVELSVAQVTKMTMMQRIGQGILSVAKGFLESTIPGLDRYEVDIDYKNNRFAVKGLKASSADGMFNDLLSKASGPLN